IERSISTDVSREALELSYRRHSSIGVVCAGAETECQRQRRGDGYSNKRLSHSFPLESLAKSFTRGRRRSHVSSSSFEQPPPAHRLTSAARMGCTSSLCAVLPVR